MEADRTLSRYEKLIHNFSGKPDGRSELGYGRIILKWIVRKL
jgi:hypothetical protein